MNLYKICIENLSGRCVYSHERLSPASCKILCCKVYIGIEAVDDTIDAL